MFKKLALTLCLLGLASGNASATISAKEFLKATKTEIQKDLGKASKTMYDAGIILIALSTFAWLFGKK